MNDDEKINRIIKAADKFIFMVRMGLFASYGVNLYLVSKIYTLEGSPSLYTLMGLLALPIVVTFICAPSWRRD